MIGCQSVSSSKYLQLWVSVTPGSPTPVPPTVRAGITSRHYKSSIFSVDDHEGDVPEFLLVL